MVFLLKSFLVLLVVAIIASSRYLISSWRETKKTDAYENQMTPIEQGRFNLIFYFMMFLESSTFLFLVYLILSKITIDPLF